MLELSLPDVDDLGRPVWSCSAADVSRAFRRLSVLVHPDKNPEPEARSAFEALSSAHRQLRDPGLLVDPFPDTSFALPVTLQLNR